MKYQSVANLVCIDFVQEVDDFDEEIRLLKVSKTCKHTWYEQYK